MPDRYWGLATEKLKRWCASCGKKRDAVDLATKMCETCSKTRAVWGMEADRKVKWCRTCAEAHEGAVWLRKGTKRYPPKCEDCSEKNACFYDAERPGRGPAGKGQLRWCRNCSAKHPGAVSTGAQDWERSGVGFGVPPLPPSLHLRLIGQ